MRRSLALLALVGLLGLTSSLRAQYPYPPSPYGPMPGYGYAPPMMPGYYGYGQMPVRPAQYHPQRLPPAMPAQPMQGPRVYNFGALPPEDAPIVTTTPPPPLSTNTGPVISLPPTPGAAPTDPPASRTLTKLFNQPHHPPRTEPILEGCGPQGCGPQGCATGSCGDSCGSSCAPCDTCRPAVPMPRPHPTGHCFAAVGIYALVAYPSDRRAFTRTDATGAATTTNFGQEVLFAPRFTLGYVCHNGWGTRVDYWFLQGGSITENASNAGITTGVATPTAAPFRIASPSATLIAGIGPDNFAFTRSIDMQMGTLECIKESSCFDMSFLCGFGARYGRITQEYNATRINPGGANGALFVGSDREELNIRSRFEGVGPTISFDAVCPIWHNCLSIYTDVRGTALFGTQRFNQNYSLQTMSTAGTVATFNSNSANTTRTAYGVEGELGLQYGKRCGPCYIFTRAGVAGQRWFDIGSPLGSTGSLSLLGGTFQLGFTY